MKLNRTFVFAAISSTALCTVLIIQVSWILNTAKMKEDLFNEKADMVLSRTAEALATDAETCRKIGACMGKDSNSVSAANLGKTEAHKIDSLLGYYMHFYKFHIDYNFKVIKPVSNSGGYGMGWISNFKNEEANNHKNSLEELAGINGLELKLVFPEKKQYILAEMSTGFISSFVLIVIVIFMFWRTILSLIREKKISEHTTDFLNNMTHEFKTPLTNIALAGKMIIKDSVVNQEDKIKHYSGIILEENEKLRLQVEQVLSMSALERGEIPLKKTVLDFHELIKESLKSINIQIENRGGALTLNLRAGCFMVSGDKMHLKNAICNLVDNAIKYSNEKPELTIETYDLGQKLVLVVSDNGIGILTQFYKKVFQPYFRIPTGDIHDVKGFGLGLAYTKKIIEMHGGTIGLKSEKGKGTTFTITLNHV